MCLNVEQIIIDLSLCKYIFLVSLVSQIQHLTTKSASQLNQQVLQMTVNLYITKAVQ